MDYDKLLNYLERKTADSPELQAASAIIGLRQRVAELEKEVAQWKNHHETEVRRARILKERNDMPIERVQAYEQWGKDQARIAELEAVLVEAREALVPYMKYVDGTKILNHPAQCVAKIDEVLNGKE